MDKGRTHIVGVIDKESGSINVTLEGGRRREHNFNCSCHKEPF